MRIVQSDNFGMGGEMPGRDDRFLLWELKQKTAEIIAKALNDEIDDTSPFYYKIVPDDYKLQIFEP